MEWNVGNEFSKSFTITEDMVVGFAQVSKDKNPVHLDEEYANKTIFKKRIAHGMLLGGLISSILGNDFPGNGTIYLNQNMSFKKPVYLEDKVTIVIKIITVDSKGWLSLETNCYIEDNIVIEGKALVIPPK
ncbi:MaoC family dehydratase [Flavobacteriaceae bacterium PRS1]|nr:MaoC family dehydratase [Flavobacteriaceae bacterium PRS1]